jgi:hypothetical protein
VSTDAVMRLVESVKATNAALQVRLERQEQEIRTLRGELRDAATAHRTLASQHADLVEFVRLQMREVREESEQQRFQLQMTTDDHIHLQQRELDAEAHIQRLNTAMQQVFAFFNAAGMHDLAAAAAATNAASSGEAHSGNKKVTAGGAGGGWYDNGATGSSGAHHEDDDEEEDHADQEDREGAMMTGGGASIYDSIGEPPSRSSNPNAFSPPYLKAQPFAQAVAPAAAASAGSGRGAGLTPNTERMLKSALPTQRALEMSVDSQATTDEHGPTGVAAPLVSRSTAQLASSSARQSVPTAATAHAVNTSVDVDVSMSTVASARKRAWQSSGNRHNNDGGVSASPADGRPFQVDVQASNAAAVVVEHAPVYGSTRLPPSPPMTLSLK